MNVLICGTRSFGAAVLNDLSGAVCRVVGVVAPLDDHKMNQHHRQLWLDRVTPEIVRELGVDLIVSAHSHAFIGEESRRAATHGAIGYHPSLLPRHRGRDAVRWTIKMGDPIAGGSVYWLTNHVDGGPIAAQDWIHVNPKWDHHDLWKELFPMGVRLLRQAVNQIDAGRLVQIDQDEAVATWEPSWERPPVFRPELIALGDGSGQHPTVVKELVHDR